MSASSFLLFSVNRSLDMQMHAIRDRGQQTLAPLLVPGPLYGKTIYSCSKGFDSRYGGREGRYGEREGGADPGNTSM